MKVIKELLRATLRVAVVGGMVANAPLFAATGPDDAMLRNDAKTTEDVLTYGMGYDQKRYSPLAKINRTTVSKLTPVWNLSLDHSANASVQPLVIDGMMYVTTHNATVAIDALTGRQKWKTPVNLPQDVYASLCCGAQSRGAAAYNGKLFRTTVDARVMALDIKTGKLLWETKLADYKEGYAFVLAPLVANGVVMVGNSGGEFGTRGFLEGLDPETGKSLWHVWTVPAPNEKHGDTWAEGVYLKGGAPTWVTGSYDPALDLVYWGTGNGGPWNANARGAGKDNLYSCSVLAIRPKTGELVWYYQFTPNDAYDYDGVNELVQSELKIDGQMRKVIMQANRNGYFYVIDRTNGQLLRANQFAKKLNWANGIDMKTGRPIESEMTKKVKSSLESDEFYEVWPGAYGAKNWAPMAFDPKRNLAYVNTVNMGMRFKTVKPEYRHGAWYLGIEMGGFPAPEDGKRGALRAIDPLTGKPKWSNELDTPYLSGVLATAGDLVFVGSMTGEFLAFDSDTGKKLWSFQTGSGITSLPITWERNGEQYVTVVSGSANLYQAIAADPNLANVPAGSSVWTFKLSK
ncbi:PQQ-dependent dehydrogenase, methanol/ethanol family [Rugosibacter aromaticivorans]|nr:PQQ-dependent dehydrogenase, methanol/ethanol family [Rugosibacter aromaticivorans]